MNINIILFNNFETLDVFGPVEIFGKLPDVHIQYYSEHGGIISNMDNIRIETQVVNAISNLYQDVLFVPGGIGTRREINNHILIEQIKLLAQRSKYVLTICTGSALLAKTGLIDGLKATSNKRAFDWVRNSHTNVHWVCKARWVVDQKFYTSSGVSAGMDMALGFVSDRFGKNMADQIAKRIEYKWNDDKEKDEYYMSENLK